MTIAARVAARFQAQAKEARIELGRTVELGSVRIHRYRDHLRVTDLTNAGRRGKAVDEATISPSYNFKGDRDAWFDRTSEALLDYNTFAEVLSFFSDLLVDFPGEIEINRSRSRGVDVEPGGLTTITLKTNPNAQGNLMKIMSKPTDWSVVSVVVMGGPKGSFTQDTLYWPSGGKRQVAMGAKLFNKWLQDNLSKVNQMTIQDLSEVWHELGIKYDFH